MVPYGLCRGTLVAWPEQAKTQGTQGFGKLIPNTKVLFLKFPFLPSHPHYCTLSSRRRGYKSPATPLGINACCPCDPTHLTHHPPFHASDILRLFDDLTDCDASRQESVCLRPFIFFEHNPQKPVETYTKYPLMRNPLASYTHSPSYMSRQFDPEGR